MKKFVLFLFVCSMILTSRAQVLTPNRTSICKGDSVNFIVSGVNNTDTVVIYSETNGGAYFDTIIGNAIGYSPDVTTVYTLFSVNDSVMFTPTICIQVHDLPIVSLYAERIACNTFAIYYDLLHGTLPVTYFWDNGVTNTTNIINGGDTACICLIDYNGCMVVQSISAPVDTIVTIDSLWSNPETCNPGLAGFHATGGQITYTWDDSSHAQIRNLCHGTYHVMASNQYGCTADTNITVGIVQNPVAIIPVFDQITSYGGTTSLSVVAVYGTSPYTYSWSNGSNEATQVVGAGSYYCVVTDANGCKDTTITVNITQPSNLFVSVDVPIIHCSDQTVEITPFVSGGVAPYIYLWNGVQVIPPIIVTNSGVYSLVVTDANGLSQTVSVSINFPTPITATITASATQVTAGTPVTLTASQADEYIWSTGATTQSIVVAPTETSNYWLFVRNNSGCSDWTSITITVTNGGDDPGSGGGTTGNQLTFELGDYHNVCWHADPIVLQNYVTVYPFNGGQVNFTGPGVAGGVFYPSSVGMSGTYQIIASYYDPVNHTTSEVAQSITVHPSTTLDWQLAQSTVGLYDAPFQLSGGIPSGGIYSGTGVVQVGNEYFFYPSTAGLGTHMLFYEYTNSWGCYSNTSKVINVVYSTSVDEFEMSEINIYPNPTTNYVIVDLSKYTYDVVLVDMLGRTLLSFGHMTGSNEISLSNLSNGVYFLRCSSESGTIITKKVIKK